MKFLKLLLIIFFLPLNIVCAQEVTDDSIINFNKKGEIEIYKYASEDGKFTEGTLNEQNMSSLSKSPLENILFKYIKIGSFVTNYSNNGLGIAYQIDLSFDKFVKDLGMNIQYENNGVRIVSSDNINSFMKNLNTSAVDYISGKSNSDLINDYVNDNGQAFPLTNKQGRTSVDNLDLGLYLVCETYTDNYYDGKQLLKTVQPFLVSLPSTNTKMSDDGNKYFWQYKVTVYPKNELVGFTKQILENGKLSQSQDFNLGQPIDFLLSINVPFLQPLNQNSLNFYNKLEVTDTYTDGLTVKDYLDDSVVVMLGNGFDNDNNKLLVKDEDYFITHSTNKFKLTFNQNGLDKLNEITADSHIYIKYQGVLNSKAALNTGNIKENKNSANVVIGTDVSNEISFENREDCYLYNYEIMLNKGFSENVEDLSKVSFSIRDEDKELYFVKENEGIYHLKDSLEPDSICTNKVHVAKDGTLVIKGVDQGTYYFKELSTLPGYNLLLEPIKVTLSKSNTVDGSLTEAHITINDKDIIDITNDLNKGVVKFNLINNLRIESLHTGVDGWHHGYTFGAVILCTFGAILVYSFKNE